MQHPYTRSDFRFVHQLKTRWRDQDAFGHINNAMFLTYFEDARIEAVKDWQLDLSENSIIVASIKMDYLKQLLHPSDVWIGTNIVRLGNTSFDTLSYLYQDDDDTPTATATITIVCFDYSAQKPTELYPQIISNASCEH